MKGMTFQEPDDRQRRAAQQAVPRERLTSVLRAGRREPARLRQERGDQALVDREDRDGGADHQTHARAPGMAPSACRICPCKASKGAVSDAGRPMMTSAARAGAAARVARNASRSRRRARFRWTALRS